MNTISITGGKGGVGKTSISCALATALAEAKRRVVLFDADLALANVDVVLGIHSEFTLQHVLNDEKTLREILHEGPGGIKVVTGASGVGTLITAGPKRLRKFLSQVHAVETDTDTMIFDTGSGIDRRVLTFLKVANDTIVVVTPDAASLTDGYATIKQLLRTQKDARVHVVVNMADDEAEAKRAFDALNMIASRFLRQDLSYIGFVRRDPIAAKCIRNRKPFMTAAPDCDAAKDIRKIAKAVLAWPTVQPMTFAERVSLTMTPRSAAA